MSFDPTEPLCPECGNEGIIEISGGNYVCDCGWAFDLGSECDDAYERFREREAQTQGYPYRYDDGGRE